MNETTYVCMVAGAAPVTMTDEQVDHWFATYGTKTIRDVKLLTAQSRGPLLSGDGNRIVSASGEVLAERPSLTRREAADALSTYAIAELKLYPYLAVNGIDVGMREAMQRARKALPLAAEAWGA